MSESQDNVVADVTDVCDPVPQPEAANPEPPSGQPAQELKTYNLAQACKAVAEFYNRQIPELKFTLKGQLTDGSVAEFTDDGLGQKLATARVRFLNRLQLDKESGDLSVVVVLTDLSFRKPSIKLSN